MNIFEGPESFLTGVGVEDVAWENKHFWAAALEVRRRLEQKAYLIDNYLSLALTAIMEKSPADEAGKGFQAYGDIYHAVINANSEESDLPQFPLIKEKLKHYHARHQDEHAVYALTNAAVSIRALPDLEKKYMEESKTDIGHAYDAMRLQSLFREISSIVGEELMERLNEHIDRRFIIVSPLDAFFQGFTEQCLYSLLHRDAESNKQVFQLILDEMQETT